MTMLVPSAKESKVIANTMVDLLRTNIAKKKVFEHSESVWPLPVSLKSRPNVITDGLCLGFCI